MNNDKPAVALPRAYINRFANGQERVNFWVDDMAVSHQPLYGEALPAAPAMMEALPDYLAKAARACPEVILYNDSTDEPYFDIGGADLWCNAEDFTPEKRAHIRFLADAANYVRAVIATAQPTPVTQAGAAMERQTMDTREKFEAWAVDQAGWSRVAVKERSTYFPEQYFNGSVQDAWLAWQARAALDGAQS